MKQIICGLDEAGRGPLAGPLVAAAVFFYFPQAIPRLISDLEKKAKAPIRDSKQLTKLQRHRLFDALQTSKAHIFVSTISVNQINVHSIGWANRQIFLYLIKQITNHQQSKTKNLKFIVDGNLKLAHPDTTIESIPKADSLYPQVSLASIVAKVTRDRLMTNLHTKHPQYGWDTNQGYGTKSHIKALKTHGITPHHRPQFVETALNKRKPLESNR